MNLYDHSLQPTELETTLHILFWKCLEWKECSKISKILKRYLYKTNPFSLALQECSSEFLTSIKSGLKKNVLLSLFSEIVANLIGKGLS